MTLSEKRAQWYAQMNAVYTYGPHAGQRVYDHDPKYRREVFALATEIAEAESAEATRPAINPEQLAWLDRAQGATTKDGVRLGQDMGPPGTQFRASLHEARKRAYEGKDISDVIASTERDLAAKGGALGPVFAGPTDKQRQAAPGSFGPKQEP